MHRDNGIISNFVIEFHNDLALTKSFNLVFEFSSTKVIIHLDIEFWSTYLVFINLVIELWIIYYKVSINLVIEFWSTYWVI